MKLVDVRVSRQVVIAVAEVLAGGYSVVDAIEPARHRDDDGRNSQRIQERREHGRNSGEQQRQEDFRTDSDRYLRKREQQQFFQEDDPRHHEDE